MDRIAAALEQCYTGAVYDSLRELGLLSQSLPAHIRPLVSGITIAGPVFTLGGHLASAATAHDTLLAWTTFLSEAPADSIIVCQPEDHTLAHMGELSAETLQARHVKGYVVDGGCRDTSHIRRIAFPVWCAYTTPSDIVARWIAGRPGESVRIGSVDIRSGDYVVADDDGVVIVPGHLAEDVAESSLALMTTENLVRQGIRNGMSPADAYLKYGIF